MFETAVIRARAADRRWLPLSLLGHITIIAAVVIATLSSTRLPEDAPKQMMPIVYARPLPVLSAPSTPPARQTAAPPKGHAGPAGLPVLRPIAAPAVIPQTIPTISLGPLTNAAPLGPIGVERGKENSAGSDASAPAAADAAGPFVAGTGGVTSPTVIRRVEPLYPRAMLLGHINGVVVLQCIIDKSGHVRDVRVERGSFAAFEQPAIDAVQQWVFTPGTLRGQPVDVIFELTVKFQVR
ncbi:MAG TPA: energy transducer TonB [Thermoanaerobaculia bacterium]|nr:energy transducer TonB [Thermoanaerobaculia bacterium]